MQPLSPQALAGRHATPLALRFLLRLRSLVQCGSLRGPQPVALRSLNVRRSDLPLFLIVFPLGFRLSTLGRMFGLRLSIAVHRLYRLFCPVRGDAVRSLMPRCRGVRVYVLHGEGCGLLLGVTTIALCFFWLISDPCRGCYMGLSMFIFFPPRFCPAHISRTVTQRLQIECAAWSCGLVVHCCLPSNSLRYFFFF